MFPLPEISIGDPTFFPQVQALLKDVEDMDRRFDDFRRPLRQSLTEVIIPSIEKNFAVQGRPKWKPLAPSTVASRKGRTGPILRRTGALHQAVVSYDNWEVTSEMVTLDYTAIPIYGVYHQLGTTKMPARPFVMYQPEDIEAIVLIFEEWAQEIIAEEWNK